MDDWQRVEEDSRRQAETVRRIHQLYKRGYRPDWSVTEVEDAIWWKHPGDQAELILYPSGMLVASLARAELNPEDKHAKDRIFNTAADDVQLFNSWLSSVPPPTWWQAGSAARERYIYKPLAIGIAWGLFALIGWACTKVISFAWRSVFG